MAEVVRIAEKTWKKDFHTCIVCEEVIPEGVSFRLKTVKADKHEYEGAHIPCVKSDPAWRPFELTPADEGLRPVREARGHCFRVGANVTLLGLPARIVGGAGGRVDVEQNGVTRTVEASSLVLA